MSIDWNTAPEGATHYAPKLEENDFWCSVFWRMENGVGVEAWSIDNRTGELHHFNRPTWIETTAKRLVPRPAACAHASTTWDGQGLPPPGTEIEYRQNGGTWLAGTYIGEFRGKLVAGCHVTGMVGVVALEEIRPLRTPEQIAAEERAKAIDAMLDLDPPHENGLGLTSRRQFCEILFDAGYRRQESST